MPEDDETSHRPVLKEASRDMVEQLTLDRRNSQLRAVTLSRDAATAFYVGDVNGDQQLSYEEFLNVVPQELRESAQPHELDTLFRTIDSNHNGYVTVCLPLNPHR